MAVSVDPTSGTEEYLKSLRGDSCGSAQVVRNRHSRHNLGIAHRKIKLPQRYVHELKLYAGASRISAAEVVTQALLCFIYAPFPLEDVKIRRPQLFTFRLHRNVSRQVSESIAPGDARPYGESIVERYGQIMLTLAPLEQLPMFVSYTESAEWTINFIRRHAGLPPIAVWDREQWIIRKRRRIAA